MQAARAYHHGDLRSALLSAARELIREQGLDGLSLRRLAERAGVSRSAPYHHFKDKQALLCALAAEGFQALDDLIAVAPESADQREQLSRFVQAYLEFATSQPERYELMFGRHLWKTGQPSSELKRTAYATFRHYAERVAEMGGPGMDERRALRLAQASWATLHGLCRLMIDGIYVDPADMGEVSELAVDLLTQGVSRSYD